MALFITKSYLHNQIVESIWLQQLGLWLCHNIVFPSRKLLIHEMLLDLVKKTKELYVTSILSECLLATTFDLRMSMGAYDVFALVVNFINVDWTPKHAMIMLFGTIETIKQTLVLKFQALFNKYDLRVKIFTYVKDEGVNLNAMITILKLVVSCENLSLEEAFQGKCFGHTMSKACQYGKWMRRYLLVCMKCPSNLAKMMHKIHYMAQEVWERLPRVDKGLY